MSRWVAGSPEVWHGCDSAPWLCLSWNQDVEKLLHAGAVLYLTGPLEAQAEVEVDAGALAEN